MDCRSSGNHGRCRTAATCRRPGSNRQDLDIASAKIVTLGDSVVDSFYLRDQDGQKFDDEAFLIELGKALDHAIRLANLRREDGDG